MLFAESLLGRACLIFLVAERLQRMITAQRARGGLK